jgi:5-hydroxyisourate hydrolase
MSQLTTHILDTTKGKPAQDVPIVLSQLQGNEWTVIAQGITNSDGRIPNLLGNDVLLQYGTYKMRFETKVYFDAQSLKSFYPFVEIVFDIQSSEHYHVPLLLNPFGYSTYRGS